MHSSPDALQHLRALAARRPLLLWLLVFVLLLKTAVPLLAAASARERGVSLAEVCSVYGVRTISAEQESDFSRPPRSEHASFEHCALTPVLGAAIAATPVLAAVELHAPIGARIALPAPALPPRDASLAWLVSRTHAPPLSV